MSAEDSSDVTFPWLAVSLRDSTSIWLNHRSTELPIALAPGGEFVATIARAGDGPGELRAPRGVFLKGDSFAISESVRQNLQLYDPNLTYVRTIPVPIAGLSQALFMRGDTLVVTYPLTGEESFGLPFHVYSPEGVWIRSFGDDNRSVRNDFTVRNRRVLSPGTDPTFWSVRYDTLAFEEWRLDGRLLRSFQPHIEWVTPLTKDHAGFGMGPIPAQILAMRVVSPDRILAIFTRPRDPDARPTANSNKHAQGVETPETQLNSLGEWLVLFDKEVKQVLVTINPQTGSMDSQVPVSGVVLIGFFSDSLMYGVRLDQDGTAIPVVHPVPRSLNSPKEN